MCNQTTSGPTLVKFSCPIGNSNRSPFWAPRRAILAFVSNFFPCIYLDVVASNYAVKRWQLLSLEQKESLPDVVHDNFVFYEKHHVFKEWPLVILYAIVLLGFLVPYDAIGLKLPVSYRRGECWVRFFETRCVLELMRACTVCVTAISDPHGLYCAEIETHQVNNIWNTWTFSRCGDNIFSGHASHLLSLGLCIQTYVLPTRFWRGTCMHWAHTTLLWATIFCLNFYIIVSRMHYTVDVITACCLVPSVWYAWVEVAGSGSGGIGRKVAMGECGREENRK